jgi:hypothetical protein
MDLVLDGHSVWLPAVAALGLGVGLVAGMFGVGGSFLMVPLLHVALGVPLRFAVGAALCQTIATGLGALIRFRQFGLAEWRFDFLAIGGSLLGTGLGARLLEAMHGVGGVSLAGRELPLERVVVTGLFVVTFGALAVVMWFTTTPPADATVARGPLARIRLRPLVDLPTARLTDISAPVVAYVGVVNGMLAGMLGIGGGIMMIPVMVFGFGFNIRRAFGTGMINVLAVSVLGTFEHARLGNVHLGLVLPLMIGAALTAQIGTQLTRTLPERTLRRGLAVVLVATVAALVLKLVR